jgi:toxin ParE1/3/4
MAGSKGMAIWSPEARRDIDDIWNYYERVAGRTVAENIVRKIDGVIATIEDYPFAGRSRDELFPGFRSLAASPYVVFYRVRENVPDIIRILDSRRDIERIFAD